MFSIFCKVGQISLYVILMVWGIRKSIEDIVSCDDNTRVCSKHCRRILVALISPMKKKIIFHVALFYLLFFIGVFRKKHRARR